jgi:hypothetical protein
MSKNMQVDNDQHGLERYEPSVEEICSGLAAIALAYHENPAKMYEEMQTTYNLKNVRQRCWATTKKERRCKLYASNRRGTCKQHQGVPIETHPHYEPSEPSQDEQ